MSNTLNFRNSLNNNYIHPIGPHKLYMSSTSNMLNNKNESTENDKFNFLTQTRKPKKFLNQSIETEMNYKIRQDIKKKLLTSINDPETTYLKNTMNRTEISFFKNKFQKNTKIRIFSQNHKNFENQNFFSNFISKLKNSFYNLFDDFNSYLTLFIKESSAQKESNEKQFSIFKSILKKLDEKLNISHKDLNVNYQHLSLYDELMKDFLFVISKKVSPKISNFLQNFFSIYKQTILVNYEIFASRIKEKESELEKINSEMQNLKQEMDKIETYNFELNTKLKNYNEIFQTNLTEINAQKEDNKILHLQIEELKSTVKIKEYEIDNLNKKIAELKKFGKGRDANEYQGINYDEKLDIDSLLAKRLERIKYYKFKRDVKTIAMNHD